MFNKSPLQLFKRLRTPIALVIVALFAALLANATQAAPAAACTTVCYVDAAAGNDANDGDTVATAKKTIQAAIDQVSAGGQVRVLPGSYSETATNRFVLGVNGPHQFGLFIEDNTKDGITIMGVTAADVPITDPTLTLADITTNATNNFGYSGTFVEADNVTITGLEFGPNTAGENKTIEIIGENFTLTNNFLSGDGIDGASIYFGDWRYDTGTSTSYMTAYTVDNNLFGSGSIITIASGTGVTGPVSGRVISNNDFTNGTGQTWPSISFRGQGGQPWYAYPVGGAEITGNTFNNDSFGAYQWIRATGIYEEPDFDWASFWNDNTYDNATVTYETSLADPRTFSYATYTNVRRIGAQIQPEIDEIAQAGDTVLVNQGTYPESPVVDVSITLLAEDGRDLTTIELQRGVNYTHSLTITGTDVTVDGFTIQGLDHDCTNSSLAATNIYIDQPVNAIVIKNNRMQVGAIGACTTGDDGFGLITEFTGTMGTATLTVEDNIFEPLNTAGQRGFYINPMDIATFTFRGNEINGQFDGNSISEAQYSLIEDNTITGTGTSGGFGLWGYLDPGVYGTGLIQGNTISGAVNAISIYDAEDVDVNHNILNANGTGVRVLTVVAPPFDQTTIHINRNAITNNTTIGINNLLDQTNYGDIDGMCNWWGDVSGPGTVGPGTGDTVSADVDFSSWLFTSNLDGPCGAYPVANVCPVDPAVGYEMTSLIGTGQGSKTKGYRTRKLVVPNAANVVGLYGQLAATDVGVMKYVRFLPQGYPKIQISAPTSPAYKAYAISWWGTDLPTDVNYVKGQFFWGLKANKSPRAFVLWPTYDTGATQYANVFETFGTSSENHVAWETGFIPTQTQTLDIPATQASGATVVVRVAVVDNDKDGRPIFLDVTVGSQTQSNTDMVPNSKDTLNLYEFTFTNVESGVDEVTIDLESPVPDLVYLDGGDSAAMIGAAASYECVEGTLP